VLTLYHANHSTCSQKVRICLAEKGLDYDSRLIDLAAKEQLDPDYLAINPNGVVPTLVHDGKAVIDSSVICEYLDDVFPDPPLSPSDPYGKAQMRAWMRYFEEVPTAAVRFPSFNMAFLPRYDGLDDDGFQKEQADVRPLRKGFFRRMTRHGFPDEDIRASFEQIAKTAARMDTALADGPWLLGETYSLADIVVAPLIDRMADLGFADLWEESYPRMTDWYARMQARSAFKTAFYPKSRLTEFLEITPWSKSGAGNAA
jgi:glutathione S-transferase